MTSGHVTIEVVGAYSFFLRKLGGLSYQIHALLITPYLCLPAPHAYVLLSRPRLALVRFRQVVRPAQHSQRRKRTVELAQCILLRPTIHIHRLFAPR